MGNNGNRRVLGKCEQCRCLEANDELAKLRAEKHKSLVAVIAKAPDPKIISRQIMELGPQDLLALMLQSKKDVGGNGFKLVQTTGAGRRHGNNSSYIAEAFGLTLPSIKFTIIEMDSSQVTEYTKKMTAGAFQESQLVGLSPTAWHMGAFKITKRMLLPGTNILVVRWSDGKDPTIIQFGCVNVDVKTKAASFLAVRKGRAQALSERGDGAFGVMQTSGKLTDRMQEQLNERGGLFVPCKGISMKHVYLHHEPQKSKRKTIASSFLHVVPHQATNANLVMVTTVAAAKAILQSCAATKKYGRSRQGGS